MSIGQSAESDTTHKIYYCLCEVLQSEITQNSFTLRHNRNAHIKELYDTRLDCCNYLFAYLLYFTTHNVFV